MFGSSKNTKTDSEPAATVTLGDGQSYRIAARVDCLGDNCPGPQFMTKKALRKAAPNDVIEIKVDNPSSMEAIPPMLAKLSATHLETVKGDRCWEIYIRKD